MNALDGFIAIIVGFAFYRGFRRGFLAALLGAGAWVLGLFLSSTVYKPLAQWLDQQLAAVAWLQNYFLQKFPLPMPAARVKVDVVPSLNLERVLKDVPLPQFYKDVMVRELGELTVPIPSSVNTLADMVANYLANSLWNALVFILLLGGLSLLAKIVAATWIRIRGEGLLGSADRLLGGILAAGATGVVLAMVLAWFYAGPAAGSPLRVETQPLAETSRLMPYVFEGNRWISERFTGYTFR